MTNHPAITKDDVQVLRESAAQLVARLGLSGFDNASILKADAWVDSPEFRAAWEQGSASLPYELGAYLGEAIIRRHGGKWSFSQQGPVIEINRNGKHFIDPFGKVKKRAQNGSVDQLLALVNLVEHVASGPSVDPLAARSAAVAALEASRDDGGSVSGCRFLAYSAVAMGVFPVVVLVILFALTDASYALIGGGVAVAVGLAGLIVFLRWKKPSAPTFAPGTLGFEAQLTLPVLRQKLEEKSAGLGARPSQEALAELSFYTTQLREVQAIIEQRDGSPGRGYVGFDTYGTPESSWARARGGQGAPHHPPGGG